MLRQFVRKSGKRYSAAFFVSDYYANEAITIFYSKGLRVPEDISVTGFDDNIYARLSRPRSPQYASCRRRRADRR